MRKNSILIFLLAVTATTANSQLNKLTVEKIMRDPKWIGTSPTSVYWDANSKDVFFKWNPEKTITDSLYFYNEANGVPIKTTYLQRQNVIEARNIVYNKNRTKYVFDKDGDIFLIDAKTKKEQRITQTLEIESTPSFSFNDAKIVYNKNQNLFSWEIGTGLTKQLTNFQKSNEPLKEIQKDNLTIQEKWLKDDQLNNFDVLRLRKQKRDFTDTASNALPKKKELKTIYINDKILLGTNISADGNYIAYRLLKPTQSKTTIVPNYVTENSFTEDIASRYKVGAQQGVQELYIYDTQKDTLIAVKQNLIAGVKDIPVYFKDYPEAWLKTVTIILIK